MTKWIIVFLLLPPFLSFSQATEFPNFNLPDTSFYGIYANLGDGVSFIYPKDWDTTLVDKRIIFSVCEKLTSNDDKFREKLFLGKIRKVVNLSDFINKLPNGFEHKKRHKIEVIQKEVKENENGVQYGILKNTAIYKGVKGLKTHIYFTARNYTYYIILEMGDANSANYNNIYSTIIQSIKIWD